MLQSCLLKREHFGILILSLDTKAPRLGLASVAMLATELPGTCFPSLHALGFQLELPPQPLSSPSPCHTPLPLPGCLPFLLWVSGSKAPPLRSSPWSCPDARASVMCPFRLPCSGKEMTLTFESAKDSVTGLLPGTPALQAHGPDFVSCIPPVRGTVLGMG